MKIIWMEIGMRRKMISAARQGRYSLQGSNGCFLRMTFKILPRGVAGCPWYILPVLVLGSHLKCPVLTYWQGSYGLWLEVVGGIGK